MTIIKRLWFILLNIVAIPLYSLMALIVLVALTWKLNIKRIPNVTPQNRNTLNHPSDYASNRTNPRCPTQYVKYVVGCYCQIVWGCNTMSEAFEHYAQRKSHSRDKKGSQRKERKPEKMTQLVTYHNKVIRRPRSEIARNQPKIEYLVDSEYLALLNVARFPEHRLLIQLLYQTGLRITEALTLTRGQVYPDSLNILNGKGNKQRVVPCQQLLLGDLFRYQETHGQPRIFQKIASEPGALYMLRRYAKEIGLGKRIHPHLFRHSFAINFLRQTMNPFALQDIGGWSDMETIKIYMRLAQEAPREAMAKMRFPE